MLNLNLRLLKANVAVEHAFRQDANPDEVETATPPGARLFVGTTVGRPSWMDLLARITTYEPDFWTQSASAVLAIPVEDQAGAQRVFLICFGGGHFLIDPAKIERNFGLKVVLNTVSRRNLRSIDSATLDATVFQRRTQASRNADLAGFGLDVQRDFLRVAAGSPTDQNFAKFVAGRDVLAITCRIDADQIPAKLRECLDAFGGDNYRQDYDWVDNVQVVVDTDELAQLDESLERELALVRAGEQSDLHMCPPEVVDYIEGQNVAYYGSGLSREKTWSSQVDLLDYVAELNKSEFQGDLNAIKSDHLVHMHKEEETRSRPNWKVYDCFVFEHIVNDSVYVLFGGTWYRVSRGYKDRVENFFQALIRPAFHAQSRSRNERELIAELDERADLLNMDQTKVNPRHVVGANLEVCDFFSLERQLIHLKDGHSSSSISHLWMQAVTSCDALMSDPTFRNGVRRQARLREVGPPAKAGFENLLPPGRQGRIDTSAYTVIYGILRRRTTRARLLDIPFFSKVSLQAPAALLQKYGFAVEMHLIEKVE